VLKKCSYEDVVSMELEFAPDVTKIVDWVIKSYRESPPADEQAWLETGLAAGINEDCRLTAVIAALHCKL
jgi:hypothetical protein